MGQAAVLTKDLKSAIYTLGEYECKKCGYTFLARIPHPCPKCQPGKFRQWKKRHGVDEEAIETMTCDRCGGEMAFNYDALDWYCPHCDGKESK